MDKVKDRLMTVLLCYNFLQKKKNKNLFLFSSIIYLTFISRFDFKPKKTGVITSRHFAPSGDFAVSRLREPSAKFAFANANDATFYISDSQCYGCAAYSSP